MTVFLTPNCYLNYPVMALKGIYIIGLSLSYPIEHSQLKSTRHSRSLAQSLVVSHRAVSLALSYSSSSSTILSITYIPPSQSNCPLMTLIYTAFFPTLNLPSFKINSILLNSGPHSGNWAYHILNAALWQLARTQLLPLFHLELILSHRLKQSMT